MSKRAAVQWHSAEGCCLPATTWEETNYSVILEKRLLWSFGCETWHGDFTNAWRSSRFRSYLGKLIFPKTAPSAPFPSSYRTPASQANERTDIPCGTCSYLMLIRCCPTIQKICNCWIALNYLHYIIIKLKIVTVSVLSAELNSLLEIPVQQSWAASTLSPNQEDVGLTNVTILVLRLRKHFLCNVVGLIPAGDICRMSYSSLTCFLSSNTRQKWFLTVLEISPLILWDRR